MIDNKIITRTDLRDYWLSYWISDSLLDTVHLLEAMRDWGFKNATKEIKKIADVYNYLETELGNPETWDGDEPRLRKSLIRAVDVNPLDKLGI